MESTKGDDEDMSLATMIGFNRSEENHQIVRDYNYSNGLKIIDRAR